MTGGQCSFCDSDGDLAARRIGGLDVELCHECAAWSCEFLDDETATNASPSQLQLLLKDIAASGRLTATEHAELAERSERGDLDARLLIVQSNQRLVVSIAKRHQDRAMPFVELIMEGTMGLVRAVERYDYRTDAAFSSYATPWIAEAIKRARPDLPPPG